MFTPKRSTEGAGISTPQSAETPRTPRANDDVAERRRRRKSAIERRRSTMVTPRHATTRTNLFSPNPQLTSPGPFSVQLPQLTPEELNQRYEEWMKIAADNKINANNTWDFALIDYFYDMSLLRDGDSINFQKASCTLDGCVKVYSSRVDSVASETGRLLSGLAEAPGNRRSRHATGDDGDDGADGGIERSRPRRAHRSENTLAKDFASISVKKLDLEFMVDPLFKKTSADFDEGGARGLLLNHLSLDAEGRIVFDASDAKMLSEDEGADLVDDGEAKPEGDSDSNENTRLNKVVRPGKQHRPTPIDLSLIDDIFEKIIQNMEDASICPSLSSFEFTRDTSLDLSILKEHFVDDSGDQPLSNENASNDGLELDIDGGDGVARDDTGLEAADEDIGINDGGDDMDHFLNFDGSDDGPVPMETASTLQTADAEEGERSGDAVLSSAELQFAIEGNEESLLSYFDSKISKSWAGPEYWRLPISQASLKQQQQQQSEDGISPDTHEPKRKRTEKTPYLTDFLNGADTDEETLFAKPSRASVITMSKKVAQHQEHTLPEDVHYSSKNLFSMFLKPKLRFNPRRARSLNTPSTMYAESAISGAVNGAVDLRLANGDDGYGGFMIEGEGTNMLGADGGYGSGRGGAPGEDFDDVDDYEDGLQFDRDDSENANTQRGPEIPQLKLIRPLYVNYARRAKRVNVKKLKENIWREMSTTSRRRSGTVDISDADAQAESGTEIDVLDESAELDTKQKFSDVVSSLKSVYPPEKLEDLSISYCFICLLHLANERNLRIESNPTLSDLTISQDHFD